MKQIALEYIEKRQFLKALDEVRADAACAETFYFQLLTSVLDDGLLKGIVQLIEDVYPGALCIASSTAGNIVNCEASGPVVVLLTLFEDPGTKFDLIQYHFNDISMQEIAYAVMKEAEARPWVKAIEMYHTVPTISTSLMCDELSGLGHEIKVFGGIVCSSDISSPDSFIYSSRYGMSEKGVMFLMIGGDALNVDAIKISGWKPIGRNFKVTRSEGNILMELDGLPAYEIYRKYLNIRNDNNFFMNALDFPLMYEHNNTTIVRACGGSNADGSLSMSANVDEGSVVRLSYGEPNTILESVFQESMGIREFGPQVMHIFSCAARKAFWTGYDPAYELKSIRPICYAGGFFSHGEFLREKGRTNQNNLTLVIAAYREGEKIVGPKVLLADENGNGSSSRLPLAARMATFIRQTSYELEGINSRLEDANRQLQGQVTKDNLTGLDNRLAFDDLMHSIETHANVNDDWTMFMFDVNGLKYVNDTYGHNAGDELIKSAAQVLVSVFGEKGHCFRIGGDEFVVLLEAAEGELSSYEYRLGSEIAHMNKQIRYPLSIAFGVSRLVDAFGRIRSISDWKMDADLCMYRNKSLCHGQKHTKKDLNMKNLIIGLISAIEAKGEQTSCHSERVSSISRLLAEKLGLTEMTVDYIEDAAILHDIGKAGISDNILFKPGKLTATEYELVKPHAAIGARILRQANVEEDIVEIVLHHHERFDGSGYPDGLSGNDIPLGARIVALADTIDAVCENRLYRGAMTPEECKAEILRYSGSIYDPAVVSVAISNWQEIEKLLMEHPKSRMQSGQMDLT